MQKLQHIHFTSLPTSRQMWNEQSLSLIHNCYVQFCAVFAAIGNKSNDDKIRPWFKRQEA